MVRAKNLVLGVVASYHFPVKGITAALKAALEAGFKGHKVAVVRCIVDNCRGLASWVERRAERSPFQLKSIETDWDHKTIPQEVSPTKHRNGQFFPGMTGVMIFGPIMTWTGHHVILESLRKGLTIVQVTDDGVSVNPEAADIQTKEGLEFNSSDVTREKQSAGVSEGEFDYFESIAAKKRVKESGGNETLSDSKPAEKRK